MRVEREELVRVAREVIERMLYAKCGQRHIPQPLQLPIGRRARYV